jgi:hypothetical protein
MFCAILYTQNAIIVLPRQARDKHREESSSTQKADYRFLAAADRDQGERNCPLAGAGCTNSIHPFSQS